MITMPKRDSQAESSPTIVVGVSNPATIPELMGLAAMVARHCGYQVVATHIVTVPEQMRLSAARSSPEVAAGSQLLRQAIREGGEHGIPVRGVVEVAREVHEGLIAAADSQNAELLLVGHSDIPDAPPVGPDKAFDRLMYKVACGTGANLIVAKFRRPSIHSIVIPVLRGLNLPVTGRLLKSIMQETDAKVCFIRAIKPNADAEEEARDLAKVLAAHDLDSLGEAEILTATDPQAAIIERANEYDLAIIGAERPTIVDAIFGNIAERIASQAACSALLVRAARKA